ncbi:hypothetical protein [Gracilimonas sediminicola]|uniref:Haemolysin XhlA n=1 Tax=Gracilimonas sediminicola TaxID=2952158 RepID=A0A9X2RAU5_9BACT|nr:hypothetical protein [Gracilimonas sediminicola]MCP9289990.1 hypothetical protein [Gracilimonas sediminicola]
MSEVTKEDFAVLQKDVSEIKTALLGNEDYRQNGALKRLEDVEKKAKDNEDKWKSAYARVIGVGIGASTIITALAWVISTFLT